MHWRILAIGKPKLTYARQGIDEYLGRLQSMATVQLDFLKASRREEESALLAQKSDGLIRVILDERGAELGSRALADKVTQWENTRAKGIALIIGGADGHTAEFRASADWLWSLSKLTLQHELALVVLLEQLYRAYTIKGGLPYHRD